MKTSTLFKSAFVAVAGSTLVAFGSADSASAMNLVQNGSFETGDFTGWTQSGNTGFTGVINGFASDGFYSAFFGPVGSLGYISQTLNTVPGQRYRLSYDLAGSGGFNNIFQVLVDGTTLAELLNIDQGFTPYSLEFVAADASTDLTFGFQNDPSFNYLDNVSATAVPTPALLPGLVGMAIAAYRKRKGELAGESSNA